MAAVAVRPPALAPHSLTVQLVNLQLQACISEVQLRFTHGSVPPEAAGQAAESGANRVAPAHRGPPGGAAGGRPAAAATRR
ncbi:hypothetical protein FRAAL0274 [Frankia alni ACN14a]|uniref:Uncharacterized protein n=1 Tax=Frankia alni (strain DSM 45986 / CECT 9034 / ACN14a) TaxID=326424 RepID=Q0RTZ4_FRAAA|nr:hypothetical protein FRAAL0274 [Frankia alni ACN14a]